MRRLTALCILLCMCGMAGADAPLFDEQTPLPVTIRAPMTDLTKARYDADAPYFDGSFGYRHDGAEIEVSVRLRSRGHFRRDNCRYLPIRLNFRKSEVDGSYLNGQNKVKLVQPCRGNRQAENWLLLEYLTYRAYALLSEHHFRTRLLELTLIDSSKGDKQRSTLAFVIEDDADTARRLGGELVTDAIQISRISERHAALYELFQFFVGNNDYSMIRSAPDRTCCHNTRLISLDATDGALIPIPYDFDHAGIVDADYARPPDRLMHVIDSVTERYFTGVCKSSPTLWQDTLQRFSQQRTALRALFDDERLSNLKRRSATRFVDSFFLMIDDPAQVERFILQRCRERSR